MSPVCCALYNVNTWYSWRLHLHLSLSLSLDRASMLQQLFSVVLFGLLLVFPIAVSRFHIRKRGKGCVGVSFPRGPARERGLEQAAEAEPARARGKHRGQGRRLLEARADHDEDVQRHAEDGHDGGLELFVDVLAAHRGTAREPAPNASFEDEEGSHGGVERVSGDGHEHRHRRQAGHKHGSPFQTEVGHERFEAHATQRDAHHEGRKH
mmetsp:Transcript_56687/g.97644  ORF Transcript_56687/g.97644 Transcript_56687/m.97644 type:complete len:209 (+) Transcript_56687:115-741(+)